MNSTTRDDRDRAHSRRFARNLALSLSGGTLLAVLGASAAHAQDAAQAGTDSAGSGAAQSGDATAVGNHSATDASQTATASGGVGQLQVIGQQANVTNRGAAVADTGRNTATGNQSDNTATANQGSSSADGGAVNNGQAANGSNGAASVSTGNASAVGNESTTNVSQTAHGGLGAILVINQDTSVTNSGLALASSGRNDAVGNESGNVGILGQTFGLDGGLAANSGKATNGSDGRATINTGSASATGNHSDTMVTQSASGSAGGDLGGLVLIDQGPVVTNEGRATARTGRNSATGNASSSGASVSQGNGNVMVPASSPDVAANQGEASSWSDGTARITTGDAVAVGNESSTTVGQTATAADTADGSLSVITQDAEVTNQGRATANTGRNTAIGNESFNGEANAPGARVDQTITDSDAIDNGVLSNSGKAANDSDGTASIATGDAAAAGNRSQTSIAQLATAGSGDLNLFPQVATVTNQGRAIADSGRNEAVGNETDNSTFLGQRVDIGVGIGAPDVDAGTLVASNAGSASNSSDGAASIATGNAGAVGNESLTSIGQTIDPTGLVLPVQVATVLNAGLGVATTGENTATGNLSDNDALMDGPTVRVGSGNAGATDIDAGILVASNSDTTSNTSDGSASITTGDATAAGNHSDTTITQDSTGSVDGLGLVLNTQGAAVANLGAAVANSGDNEATGNLSTNTAVLGQVASVGSDNGAGDTDVTAGVLTATNSGTASNTSDGTATIATGAATATGNHSSTSIAQSEDASVDGLGAVINTQAAVVANVGLGAANSGGNTAIGNDSTSNVHASQEALIGSGNGTGQVPTDTDILAGTITAANAGRSENASDGSATIATGSATAIGNVSSTDVTQTDPGAVHGLGLVVDTQVAGVLNAGVGVANSGLNLAVGNASDNTGGDNTAGAGLTQEAQIGSNDDGVTDVDVTAVGPMVAANDGTASNTSDGTATIRTGAAWAQGNASTTSLRQSQDGTIDGSGVALDTQVAGVANIGIGVANSGLNAAVGNLSSNDSQPVGGPFGPGAVLGQSALIGSEDTGGTVDITGIGPVIANNAGEASNTSDGTARVGTGNATANGNVSSTDLSQHQTTLVTDGGLALATQVGGVANVGLGVANSGLNAAVGNASTNAARSTQEADVVSGVATPTAPITVVGPLAANNSGQATNSSDGEACVCTGDATASGNVSSTTLVQDLDTSVGSGVVVLTEVGGVLNAGVGIANSGLNLAAGNTSDNTAAATQTSTINDGLDPGDIVGPQIAHNGGGATNASAGTGKVGSGKASATGNLSTTNLVQAAAVDSDFAVATLAGGTTNTGLGLANSGLNVGVGNDSTNVATLTQTADGAGIVSNDGTADNASDGTAIIGNPDCLVPGPPIVVNPPPPGIVTLPKTGGPLEAEAVFGLMLLLAGFALRRKANAPT